jgi:hypothetical protein
VKISQQLFPGAAGQLDSQSALLRQTETHTPGPASVSSSMGASSWTESPQPATALKVAANAKNARNGGIFRTATPSVLGIGRDLNSRFGEGAFSLGKGVLVPPL